MASGHDSDLCSTTCYQLSFQDMPCITVQQEVHLDPDPTHAQTGKHKQDAGALSGSLQVPAQTQSQLTTQACCIQKILQASPEVLPHC